MGVVQVFYACKKLENMACSVKNEHVAFLRKIEHVKFHPKYLSQKTMTKQK